MASHGSIRGATVVEYDFARPPRVCRTSVFFRVVAMSVPRLLVTLCTCNERENLGEIVPAILAGFRYAIEHQFDWLTNLDADFSHHPRHLPALLECMDRCDVAIGSRYVKGGGVVGWGFRRHFMSQGINWYARLLLGLRTRDNSGSYRCYRVSKLAELDLDRFRSRGYAFQEEALYRCRKIGCRFEETPILFEDRRHGESGGVIADRFSSKPARFLRIQDGRVC
jgi:hypothetical protein